MPTLVEQMAADAQEAMKVSRKYFVAELDYSPESLEKFAEMFSEWKYAMPGGETAENIERLVRVWGAYLGETVRRALGGDWALLAEQGAERPALRCASQTLLPHDEIRRRLAQSADLSLSDLFAQFKSSASA